MSSVRSGLFGLVLVWLGLIVPTRALTAEPAAPTANPSSSQVASPAANPAKATGDTGAKKSVELRQDRIKSIQPKGFLKRHRFELTPIFSFNVNDAFYQRIGGGASAAYHLADNLAFELQGVYYQQIQTDMVGFFQRANTALPKVSQLRFTTLASLQWSPIYGKLSLITDDIVFFDAYLLGGFGLAYTETGSKMASNLGIGLRYFLTSWLEIKLEVRDVIYTETLKLNTYDTQYSDIQNHVFVTVGVSFFLPVDFEYKYQ